MPWCLGGRFSYSRYHTTKGHLSQDSGELACNTNLKGASKLSRPGAWWRAEKTRGVGHLRPTGLLRVHSTYHLTDFESSPNWLGAGRTPGKTAHTLRPMRPDYTRKPAKGQVCGAANWDCRRAALVSLAALAPKKLSLRATAGSACPERSRGEAIPSQPAGDCVVARKRRTLLRNDTRSFANGARSWKPVIASDRRERLSRAEPRGSDPQYHRKKPPVWHKRRLLRRSAPRNDEGQKPTENPWAGVRPRGPYLWAVGLRRRVGRRTAPGATGRGRGPGVRWRSPAWPSKNRPPTPSPRP